MECAYKLGEKIVESLSELLEECGYNICQVEEVNIELEGPVIKIKLSGEDYYSYIDVSPGGCEHTVVFPGIKVADPLEVEEKIAEAIESGEEFNDIDDYDVFYDDEDNSLTLVFMLPSALLSRLSIHDIRRIVFEAVSSSGK